MKDLLLALLNLAVTVAKLCRRGGVRAVIAENLLLKQQLIVLRRARKRAPVAAFHLGNGASIERINWLADTSDMRMDQSGRMTHFGRPTSYGIGR